MFKKVLFLFIVLICVLSGCNLENDGSYKLISAEDVYAERQASRKAAKEKELQLIEQAKVSGAATVISICERTGQVNEAILEKVQKTDCSKVTVEDLKAILYLEIDDKGIKELKEGDFSGLTSLQVLSLSSNQLASLSSNQFSDLTSLEDLDLGSNLLTGLSSDQFSSLTSLKWLTISYNQLTGLSSDQFSSLTSLKVLSLAHNHLTNLPLDQFLDLTSLKVLNLINNKFTETEKARIKEQLKDREGLTLSLEEQESGTGGF